MNRITISLCPGCVKELRVHVWGKHSDGSKCIFITGEHEYIKHNGIAWIESHLPYTMLPKGKIAVQQKVWTPYHILGAYVVAISGAKAIVRSCEDSRTVWVKRSLCVDYAKYDKYRRQWENCIAEVWGELGIAS